MDQPLVKCAVIWYTVKIHIRRMPAAGEGGFPMSRNWYIQTDQRNIQKTFDDIDVTPLSFREKWQKHRKKYILWAIEAAAVIGLLVLGLPGMLPRNTTDYTVTLVTETAIGESGQQALASALAAVGEDLDGNGKVEVTVRALAVGDALDNAPEQRHVLFSSFFTREYTLFAMEKSCYERYVAAYEAQDRPLFVPLPDTAGALMAEGTLWPADRLSSDLPKSLLFGVRALAEEDTLQQAHLALLQALIRASQ